MKDDTTSNREKYSTRITKVVDYINSHLDDDLSLQTLSSLANFSKFHFHRQFSSFTGISCIKLVQLMRLKRASYQLVFNSKRSVIDISFEAGFENPESFSRAFKKAHKQTPSEFRANPQWQPWLKMYTKLTPTGEINMQAKIVDFPTTKVAKRLSLNALTAPTLSGVKTVSF